MRTLISMVILLVVTASCTNQVKPYKTWECHRAVRFIPEWRGNCVIYEAVVEQARLLAEMGARPYSVRMNENTMSGLTAESQVVRHRLSSGGALWVVDTTYGAMRVIKDDRLGDGQFIVGRGWNVTTLTDSGLDDNEELREVGRNGEQAGGDVSHVRQGGDYDAQRGDSPVRPGGLQQDVSSPDNDVEF